MFTDWFSQVFRYAGHLPKALYDLTIEDDEEGVEDFEPFSGPLDRIPGSRKEAYKVFGDPGVGDPDPSFQRQRMIVAKGLPGTWNGGKGRLYCHRLAEPYLREALRRSELVALGHIHRLGCYNFRHIRHDTSRPLSYHSWGIACDLNPKENRSRNRKKHNVPQPFQEGWSEIWPDGLPEKLVRAWTSVGWRWGGDWRNYIDPMHFQLVA